VYGFAMILLKALKDIKPDYIACCFDVDRNTFRKKEYKEYKANDNVNSAELSHKVLKENMSYFGYGYLQNPEDIVPPIALTFYAFHIMVLLGGWFIVLFAIVLYLATKRDISDYRTILKASLYSIPLGYIAAEAGWIVAEVGRQPWAIQDLMPVGVAVTDIASSNVAISFFIFAFLFTLLLIAEIKIMLKQIKIGPNGGN
jgi:cytochrome d ubiquinol oxidase subunit I